MTSRYTPALKWVFPVMLLCLALPLFGWRSMTDAPGGASSTAFNAEAGMATLTELLREQVPHPIGSENNHVVRDRILSVLRGAGYEAAVDAKLHCTAEFGCAQVENLIAVRRGTDPSRAVMISAHYDSVPAGPGASDDGAGVAIALELAKELARRPPTKNDVVFMISDGEELGTFGAEAFASTHADSKRVTVMVNLEARGTAGPSVMFETGPGNANLMKLYGDAVARPVANSLAFEIYKRLPNGTDFTVYRDRGVIGFNLAFIGRASLYHTPYDDLQHLDRATLQHHGDNAFALVTALADADLAAIASSEDASYFDVFGRLLVQWPASWNLPLAGAALLVTLVLVGLRRRDFTLGKVGWTIAAVLGALALQGLLGWLLTFPLGRWPGALKLDHPMPWPGRIALLMSSVTVAVAVGGLLARRGAAAAATWGVWAWIALCAVLLAAFVPGGAYALLWPAAAFAGAALLAGWWSLGAFLASFLGFALMAFFWVGHMTMFESALGFPQSLIKSVLLTPLVWAAIPVAARAMDHERTGAAIPLIVSIAGVIAASAAAVLVPAVTRDTPLGVDLVYYDDGAQPPRWGMLSTDLDGGEFPDAAGFPAERQRHYALGTRAIVGRMKPATPLALSVPTFAPAPSAAPGADGARVLRGTIHLAKDAVAGGLTVGHDAGVLSVRVDGQPVWGEEDLRGRSRSMRLAGVSGRDVALELTLAPDAKGPVILYQRLALPATSEVRALQAARPADATPFGVGDCAIIMRRIKL